GRKVTLAPGSQALPLPRPIGSSLVLRTVTVTSRSSPTRPAAGADSVISTPWPVVLTSATSTSSGSPGAWSSSGSPVVVSAGSGPATTTSSVPLSLPTKDAANKPTTSTTAAATTTWSPLRWRNRRLLVATKVAAAVSS